MDRMDGMDTMDTIDRMDTVETMDRIREYLGRYFFNPGNPV